MNRLIYCPFKRKLPTNCLNDSFRLKACNPKVVLSFSFFRTDYMIPLILLLLLTYVLLLFSFSVLQFLVAVSVR